MLVKKSLTSVHSSTCKYELLLQQLFQFGFLAANKTRLVNTIPFESLVFKIFEKFQLLQKFKKC
jgi:hypothetical protein